MTCHVSKIAELSIFTTGTNGHYQSIFFKLPISKTNESSKLGRFKAKKQSSDPSHIYFSFCCIIVHEEKKFQGFNSRQGVQISTFNSIFFSFFIGLFSKTFSFFFTYNILLTICGTYIDFINYLIENLLKRKRDKKNFPILILFFVSLYSNFLIVVYNVNKTEAGFKIFIYLYFIRQ